MCRKDGHGKNRIALAGTKPKLEREKREMENGESLVSFCPPLPHAWELEGWPVDEVHRTGCELRRSPGLAGEFGPVSGPVRGLPTMTPGFPDPNGPTKRFIAVTCAVSIPPYSRASATAFLLFFPLDFRGCNKCNLIRVARLPEHEVRGDSEGRSPLVVAKCRYNGRGVGLTRKVLRT